MKLPRSQPSLVSLDYKVIEEAMDEEAFEC